MARPRPLLILVSLLIAAPLAAQDPATTAARPFDSAVTAAEMIKSVVENAKLRRVPGNPQIVLLWQDQPRKINTLAAELRRKLPSQSTVADPLSTAGKTMDALLGARSNLVCVVAAGLPPDTLQLLSYWSRAHGVLTIGAEADIDPLSVGLQLEGTMIYCSRAALSAEKVTVGFLPCRPLPIDRTVLPGDGQGITENTRLLNDHAQRRKRLNAWQTPPVQPKVRDDVFGYARVIQHEIGVRPTEGWITGRFSGGRQSRHVFLPYYQLGRAFYLLGNCEAALPALKESRKQNLAMSVEPEKTGLLLLLGICLQQTGSPIAFLPVPKPWTFTAAREPYWRFWDSSGLTESE